MRIKLGQAVREDLALVEPVAQVEQMRPPRRPFQARPKGPTMFLDRPRAQNMTLALTAVSMVRKSQVDIMVPLVGMATNDGE